MYLTRQETEPPVPATSVAPVFDFSLVDLEGHGGTILSITGFFTGFAVTAVLARIYVRAFMLKTMGVDDFIMIVAMVSWFLGLWCAQSYRTFSYVPPQ